MTDDEKFKKAQFVYDSVLKAFPGLHNLMVTSQAFARKHGYVETILGRRRHLPDMKLPEFEFEPMPGYVNPDIDPLDINSLANKESIPERIVKQLQKEFKQYKYFGQIAKRTKQLYEEEKIRVKNNRAKINDATRQVVNCVDVYTEILTTSGWKSYNQVQAGDSIYAYDVFTKKLVKSTVKQVHIYDSDTYSVVCMDHALVNSVSTLDHRWVVDVDGNNHILTSKDLSLATSDCEYKLRCTDNYDSPYNALFTKEELLLIALIVNYGEYNCTRNEITITLNNTHTESKDLYMKLCDIFSMHNISYTVQMLDDRFVIYLHHGQFVDKLFENLPKRKITFDFISTLSQLQCGYLVNFLCDNWKVDLDYNLRFVTEDDTLIDEFQALCLLSGYTTSFDVDHVYVPRYTINVYRDTTVNLTDIEITKKYTDKVWCVTTEHDTWIARREGTCYITGNSRIQGSAADLTKMAMLRLENDPTWQRIGGKLLIAVHDELIAEVPMEYADIGAETLSRCMVEAADFLPFPSKCDTETSLHWYGLEFPCPFSKPKTLDNLSTEDIEWLQYMLYTREYELPKHKEELGENFRGLKAKGIDGIWDDILDTYIVQYCDRYGIDKSDFIDSIETHVYAGIAPNLVK